MANQKARPPISALIIRISLLLSLLLLLTAVPTAFAKSRRPITDLETRQKKNQCYADIESGLWGWQCKSSATAKENCALRCLSPTCYDIIYESDPLEEGEKDLVRGQEFKYCMHKYVLAVFEENISQWLVGVTIVVFVPLISCMLERLQKLGNVSKINNKKTK